MRKLLDGWWRGWGVWWMAGNGGDLEDVYGVHISGGENKN